MKPRRIQAVSRKEFLHIRRDPRSLIMAIVIPIMLLLLFGYALTLDVDNVPMIIWDQDNTAVSREFISRFSGSRYLSLSGYVYNYRDLIHAIDSGNTLMGLVIPAGFAGHIESGRETPVQLIIDGSDSNTATIALGYVDAITMLYTQDVAISNISNLGGREITLPVDARTRVWYNPDLDSKNYIIPGLIAVIMMVIAALLTSLTVAREWENGTMEQLISTPVKGPELILGKLIPYFAIGVIDVVIAVLLGELLFEVPLHGSPVLLLGIAVIFLTGSLALGILISIVTKSQLLASQLAMVTTFLPSFLLSGFVYSIGNMPQPIRIITYLIPARYFVTALKGIYLKGVGLRVIAMDVLFLLIFGVVVILFANLKFKKKLE